VCLAALLVLLAASAPPQARRRGWRSAVGLTLVALVLTGLTYGVARAAEPWLPGLKAAETEAHEHDGQTPHEHEPAPDPQDDY
jgi:hypothetical protein